MKNSVGSILDDEARSWAEEGKAFYQEECIYAVHRIAGDGMIPGIVEQPEEN